MERESEVEKKERGSTFSLKAEEEREMGKFGF